jgi:hypothetical protein
MTDSRDREVRRVSYHDLVYKNGVSRAVENKLCLSFPLVCSKYLSSTDAPVFGLLLTHNLICYDWKQINTDGCRRKSGVSRLYWKLKVDDLKIDAKIG